MNLAPINNENKTMLFAILSNLIVHSLTATNQIIIDTDMVTTNKKEEKEANSIKNNQKKKTSYRIQLVHKSCPFQDSVRASAWFRRPMVMQLQMFPVGHYETLLHFSSKKFLSSNNKAQYFTAQCK